MTELFIELIKEYGYGILFIWSILEGEMGLIMGGILSHTGHMSLPIAIFVAGLGGFTGDQIYFYIGRYNKNIFTKTQKTKKEIRHSAHTFKKTWLAYHFYAALLIWA